MFAFVFLIRFLGIGLLVTLPGAVAAAAAETVGTVTRVQNHAQVGNASATVGTPVRMNNALRTGANARLEVTFRDGTKLTLGENARIVVDRYAFNPSQGSGEMTVSAARGAMRFVTGKIGQMKDHDVTVVTSHTALAVRGTDVWVGPINGQYGTLLLKGKVRVSRRSKK